MRAARLALAPALLIPMLALTAGVAAPPSGVAADGGWRHLDAPGPGHRYGAMTAYDPALRATVLFGGYTLGETTHADTWLFDGRRWHRVVTRHAPSGRTLAAFAYSPTLRRMVLFGGLDPHVRPQDLPSQPCGVRTDTWTFDGHDWTAVTSGQDPTTCTATPSGDSQNAPGPQPIGRYGASMAWDAGSRSLLLFGGYGCSAFPAEAGHCGYLADTWRFTYRWTRLTVRTSPPGRLMAQMASDDQGGVLLFGGTTDGIRPVLGDTWVWRRTQWVHEHPATAPVARAGAGVTAWPGHGVVVVGGHGFCTDTCPSLADMWLWHRGHWSRLATGSPEHRGRYLPALATDHSGRVILAGGLADTSAGPDQFQSRETFSYDGHRWRKLPYPWPEASAALGFWWDPHRHADVLLDAPWLGASPSTALHTWVLSRGHWRLDTAAGAPVPARLGTTAGYDPVRDEAVVFGGQNEAVGTDVGWYSDTWVLRHGRWQHVQTPHRPPAGTATITYDPALRALVMQLSPQDFNAAVDLDSPAPYNDSQLWRWTGSDWLPLPTLLGPSDPRQHAMFGYVPSRRALALSGGYRGLVPREDLDTIELSAGGQIWMPVPGHAPSLAGSADAVTTAGDQLVFGGCTEDLLSISVGGRVGADSEDATDGLLSVRGGCTADTWQLSAAGWRRLQTSSAPGALAYAVMARRDDGHLLLFGGQTLAGFTDDLWVWNPA